jgi:hypothetical protein
MGVERAVQEGRAIEATPLRARLSFRVGVVGDRPSQLPKGAGATTLYQRLFSALSAVRDAVQAFAASEDAKFYASQKPLLTAISPLAEGIDRMFAGAALELGYRLLAPLPRQRAEFARDFAEGHSFDDQEGAGEESSVSLLTTFELDDADTGANAYAVSDRIVLNQCDMLIAIGDGAPGQGSGSAGDTVREAIGFNIPVLWIASAAPFAWRWLAAEDVPIPRGDLATSIATVVQAELSPLALGEAEAANARGYFAEEWQRFNRAFVWKSFRNIVGDGQFKLAPLRIKPIHQINSWPDAGPLTAFDAGLRRHFAWADRLAERYADAHRSAVVVTSLFAAFAVLLALLPVALHWGPADHLKERLIILTELTVMLVVLGNFWMGRRRRWHERWLEYRTLAEMIRHLRLLAPLGGARPLPRGAAHLAVYGEPTRSWMYWHLRAIAREARLPQAVVDRSHLAAHMATLGEIVGGGNKGQIGFHASSGARSNRIRHRLHLATVGLVTITIFAVYTHLIVIELTPPEFSHAVSGWLVLLSAVAPAFGAAVANINNQGEFQRLAKRNEAMAEALASFRQEIAEQRLNLSTGHKPDLPAVTSITDRVAGAMLHEVVDWRVIVVDRPMAPA